MQCEYLSMAGDSCAREAAVQWQGEWLCRVCYIKSKEISPEKAARSARPSKRRGAPARAGIAPVTAPIPNDSWVNDLLFGYPPGALACIDGKPMLRLTEEGYWLSGDDIRWTLDQAIAALKPGQHLDVFPHGTIGFFDYKNLESVQRG